MCVTKWCWEGVKAEVMQPGGCRAWWHEKGGHGGGRDGLVSVRRPAGGRARRALQERNWNECLDGWAKERLLILTVSRTQSSSDLLVNLMASTGARFLPLKRDTNFSGSKNFLCSF